LKWQVSRWCPLVLSGGTVSLGCHALRSVMIIDLYCTCLLTYLIRVAPDWPGISPYLCFRNLYGTRDVLFWWEMLFSELYIPFRLSALNALLRALHRHALCPALHIRDVQLWWHYIGHNCI
jgi:hypothetical protein